MDVVDFVTKRLGRVNPRLLSAMEKRLTSVPAVKTKIEKEYDGIMEDLESALKPYREQFVTYDRLPPVGRDREDVLREMEALSRIEAPRWREGFVSGAVYHGDEEHVDFLNRVCAIHSQSNPLHADVWPSTAKFEAEIVSMTAHMLGAGATGSSADVCGTVTSGG